MKFIFFSKSMWTETPRLRHQLASLLINYQQKVIFFQKPHYFWENKSIEMHSHGLLQCLTTKQLIHHQLRLIEPLRYLNAHYEVSSIKSKNIITDEDDVIINFNYDYYFIREIYKNNKIVTVINDDFIAQAKFFSGRHVANALEKTCKASDVVLTVSYPLIEQLSPWCNPQLFLPWADVDYMEPTFNTLRNRVLLWAHIDGRIDFTLLENAALLRKNIEFYIVGPKAKNIIHAVESISEKCKNIIVLPPQKLTELPINSFFAAIIPYKNNVRDIEAITASNKTFQLMTRGLPIVTHGTPYFLDHTAIMKSSCLNDFLKGIDLCFNNYDRLQASIKDLISHNQPNNRYLQLLSYLK